MIIDADNDVILNIQDWNGIFFSFKITTKKN